MPDSFSSDGLRRIRRLAWVVRALCLLGVVVIGTLPFIFWAEPDWVAEVASKLWAVDTLQLDLGSRLWGLAASLLPASVSLFALWQMWSLFGCFAQGELLTRRPAQHRSGPVRAGRRPAAGADPGRPRADLGQSQGPAPAVVRAVGRPLPCAVVRPAAAGPGPGAVRSRARRRRKRRVHLMPIVVTLDVMLARRKMRSRELAERVGITEANL